MGGYIKVDAERAETTALNTKINKDVFEDFKIYCKTLGYPMNVLLETFMRQYTKGNFGLSNNDILKFNKTDKRNKATINTTFNKKIYTDFKTCCKDNGYFVSSVIMAFMEEILKGNYVMEFIETKDE